MLQFLSFWRSYLVLKPIIVVFHFVLSFFHLLLEFGVISAETLGTDPITGLSVAMTLRNSRVAFSIEEELNVADGIVEP